LPRNTNMITAAPNTPTTEQSVIPFI
jgi:hypothetical protein